MELLYVDDKIVVCIKPAGVPSTDEPGGAAGTGASGSGGSESDSEDRTPFGPGGQRCDGTGQNCPCGF